MFNLLNFQPHRIPDAIHAVHKFENGWSVSIVSGPSNCGLYGVIDDETYEIMIIRPNDVSFEDVSGWNTKEQISAMMWVVSQI
jgi:hypothetical protein